MLHELGTLLYERMGAGTFKRLDTAWYGKYLPVLFCGQACRYQRTAFAGCLNNHGSQ